MAAPHEGGCQCGAIRFEATAAPLGAGYCHCTKCRGATGAPIFLGVAFPRAAFRLLRGETKTYRSSERGIRHFCGACGSPLFFELTDTPDRWEVLVGALDDAADITPSVHVCTASRLPWFDVLDSLPRKAAL